MSAPVLQLDRVCIRYPGAPADAVRGVSFDLRRGETLGLVGESGSGKSTLAAAMMGLLPAGTTVQGAIRFEGRALFSEVTHQQLERLRGRRIGTISQDPFTALNPVMRVGTQLDALLHWTHDRPKNERMARIEKMLERVGLSDPKVRMRQYPHQMSGGILQRISIAAAMLAEPTLLIADEPTTALDATTEAQILGIMDEAKTTLDGATLFITHDMSVVERLCDRIAVLYAGELVETGTVREVLEAPQHPYTRALLDCDPARITEPTRRLPTIEGTVPPIHKRPDGCIFAPRCPSAIARCHAEAPERHELGPRRSAACHLAGPTPVTP